MQSRLDIIRSNGVISIGIGLRPDDPTRLEDTLWNVGVAISGLRAHGSQLEFTDSERNFVVELISQWVRTPVPSHSHLPIHWELLRYTHWVIGRLDAILSEVEIPEHIAESLFEKLSCLPESSLQAFGPVSELLRVMPHRRAELTTWLRTGLASGNRDIAAGAITGLFSWLRKSSVSASSVQSPTEDLLREVGLIIAVRRKESLSDALQLARWIFDKGSDDARQIILNFVLEGLDYLTEELRYDREHDGDVTKLRWRCAELASSMAKAGLECEPVVVRWLELASSDPFPEVRYASTDYSAGA